MHVVMKVPLVLALVVLVVFGLWYMREEPRYSFSPSCHIVLSYRARQQGDANDESDDDDIDSFLIYSKYFHLSQILMCRLLWLLSQ